MAPHISIREFIRMPSTSAAEEPTSTLVLTSSANRFVDIRVLKNGREPVSDVAKDAAILPLSHLDWAFAGTSSSQITHHVQDGSPLFKSTWKHWIDSRTTEAENVVDEGFMFPGSDKEETGRTLEKGTMMNSQTGKMEDYEEMWRDVSEEGEKGEGEEKKEKEKMRGMVIRLGQFCQGLMRIGEEITLERWEWTAKENWKRSFRMGDFFLPCGVAMEFDRLQLGGKITHGGLTWDVVELEEN
ncbi:uncharacterized protein SEPMUDRAFT_88638 [Sphaerulina musiva SO2202]|uniref:Protein HRI1 n=1 Tax=Sphaerulina musiva (strain SO2202) TaxID=692275 RepID=M3D191_SPHMS|nr:uncharacterized protein SEPMUDRAFT_88638 [Sphaerulina musiva SO2202]EMF11248.1 hypothetical protein SEPMUDRAFT_88638 [Sphaerulina musiva SO2202]